MIDEQDPNAAINSVDSRGYPNIDVLALRVHETAVEKGFWDIQEAPSLDKIMAKLALVHSEVTEILEAIRKGKGADKVVEEMADTIIRVLDLYGAMWEHNMVDVSLQDSFDNKVKVNRQRPSMHGYKWG